MNDLVRRDIREAVHSAFTFGVSVKEFLSAVETAWDEQARESREAAAREFRTALGKEGGRG